jgi:hypothetical protein
MLPKRSFGRIKGRLARAFPLCGTVSYAGLCDNDFVADEEIPPSRRFEELVAEYYRGFGASVARVDVELGGRQIDVYVEEVTGSGALVRTAIECKKYAGVVGAEIVTAFAGVVLLLKHARLIDKAVIVAERGFSKPARPAAGAADIELFTLADLKARRDSADAIELLTIAHEDLVVSLKRDGRILRSAYSSRYSLYDQNLVQRVKLLAEYLIELEQLTLSPSGTLVIVDATGAATEFANWLTNPLYGAILQASSRYADAYRKTHGEKGAPRCFRWVGFGPAANTPARSRGPELSC